MSKNRGPVLALIAVLAAVLTFITAISTAIFASSKAPNLVTVAPTFTITPYTFIPSAPITDTPDANIALVETLFPTETSTPTATFTETPTPTPTLTLTFTSIPTATSDPEQFRGLDKNCIEQKYWNVIRFQGEVEPATYKQNSKTCYDLSSVGVISYGNGLRINASPLRSPFFAMYTTLPTRKDINIHFKLKIESFTLNTNSIDGILILGISTPKDWYFENGEYLFYGIRPAYQTKDIVSELGPDKLKAVYRQGNALPGTDYDILFSIKGIDLYAYFDNVTVDKYYPRSLSKFNGQMVFWIGYQLPVGKSNLRVYITDFSITEK